MYMRITMGRTMHGVWNEFELAYRQHIEAKPVHGLQARWLVRSGALRSRPLYSLPASLERQEIDDYFSALLRELAAAPRGTPLPGVGPQAEVYRPD